MKDQYWNYTFEKLKSGYDDDDNSFDNINVRESKEKIAKFIEIVVKDEERPLEKHQFDCFLGILPIALSWAFGSKYFALNKQKLKKNYRLKTTKKFAIIIIKRQFGKTELLVRIMVASFIVFDNIDNPCSEMIYTLKSHKGEHAKEVLERVKNTIERKKDYIGEEFEWYPGKCATQRKLVLKNKYNKFDVREIRVTEGNIDGKTSLKLFGDEYFKWKEVEGTKQLIPQFQIEDASGIFATTLQNRKEWTNRIMRDRNNPDSVFIFLYILDVCFPCLETEDIDIIMNCNHLPKLQAHFVNPDKRKNIANLLSKRDQLTELKNIIPSASGQIWREYLLKDVLFTKKKIDHDEFFMFCDPSMTSKDGSYTATTIVGQNELNGEYSICYINQGFTGQSSEIKNFIVEDLNYFVFKFMKRKQHLFLFIENNVLNWGEDILFEINANYQLRECVTMIQGIKLDDDVPRYGVLKKAGYNERFAKIMDENIQRRNIFLNSRCITRNKNQSVKELVETLINQMLNVRIKNGRVTSKKDINGRSINDDLYISCASAVFHTKEIKTSDCEKMHIQWRERMSLTNIANVRHKNIFLKKKRKRT